MVVGCGKAYENGFAEANTLPQMIYTQARWRLFLLAPLDQVNLFKRIVSRRVKTVRSPALEAPNRQCLITEWFRSLQNCSGGKDFSHMLHI
jgi:hypothetical protein